LFSFVSFFFTLTLIFFFFKLALVVLFLLALPLVQQDPGSDLGAQSTSSGCLAFFALALLLIALLELIC
jgi:hypothetical protein